MTILIVIFAKEADEIALFELDPDQDVSCGRDGEEQMPGCHMRRRPGTDDQPKHQGMANITVEAFRFELDVMVILVRQVEPDLAEPEQVEVVDDERGKQYSAPSEPEENQ